MTDPRAEHAQLEGRMRRLRERYSGGHDPDVWADMHALGERMRALQDQFFDWDDTRPEATLERIAASAEASVPPPVEAPAADVQEHSTPDPAKPPTWGRCTRCGGSGRLGLHRDELICFGCYRATPVEGIA